MKMVRILDEHTLSPKQLKSLGKFVCFLSSLFAISCSPHIARAEGTKELTSSGGYRPSTMYQSTGQYFGISYKTIIKVYAKAGETIHTGSSANGLGSGSIRLTAPNGTVYTSTGLANQGVIQDRNQELAGPAPNSGGYIPFSRTVAPGETGIWTVDFISPNPSSTSTVAPVLAANAAWTRTTDQPNNLPILIAWDVTVRNSTGIEIKGRSYTNSFGYTMGNYDPVTLSSIFYVLTKDGYQYAVDANALGPFASIFFSNNRGWKTPGGTAPSYQSAPILPGNVQDPLDPDTANDITNKLFFNTPAIDLPSSSTSASGLEWLLVPPVIPIASNTQYTSSGASGGTFTFTANVAGSYDFWMDINNNGSYNDPADRILQGINTAGTNSILWDGKNGLGATVNNPVNFPVRVATRSGEVHFPMIDAESSLSGIKITRLNGILVPDSYIYWDDTSIIKSGFTSTKSITGTLSSPGGAHIWGPGGATGYGDAVGIDTWAFARGDWKFFGIVISGRVFEDINYGGGSGRDLATATASAPRPNARVELYDSAGNFKAFTTTDGAGHYEFSTIPGGLIAGNYTVRVVNSTVTSSRGTGINLIPVQTYRVNASTGTAIADLERVGGEAPQKIDASANTTNANLSSLTTSTTTPQSIAPVKVGIINIPSVNFGYNFDTIVNTNESGQGSLEQFITNSNALGGEASLTQSGNRKDLANVSQPLPSGRETSIFMIPDGNAHPGLRSGLTNQLTSGVAVISTSLASSATSLMRITGANSSLTNLDGSTQTVNIGDSNGGQLGTGGTVGTNPINLNKIYAPEVQIVGKNTIVRGLEINNANDVTVRGISIFGFGSGPASNNGNIYVNGTSDRTIIENNAVGISATTFSSPSAAASGSGVLINTNQGVTIQNNLIGFNYYRGIGSSDVSPTLTITGNEINMNNRSASNAGGGIELTNATTLAGLINNNLISNQAATAGTEAGIEIRANTLSGTTSTLLIENNTVTQNNVGIAVSHGANLTPPAGTTISKNVITANQRSGAVVGGIVLDANAKNIKITQNSIYNNQNLGIDLGWNGVTADNGTISATLANNDIDYPIITSSTLSGSTLTVKGFVGNNPAGSTTFANAKLEFFIADNSPADQNGEVIINDGKSKPHGEGKTYIGFCTADGNGLFGTATKPCVLSNVPAALTDASNITATATDANGNTSEFSAPPSNIPNLILVKRITAINPGKPGEIRFNSFVNDPGTTNDNNSKWPDSDGIPGNNINEYLRGVTNVPNVKPGDEVEYTIYFLSSGNGDAKNVQICDAVPDNMTFNKHSYGTEVGITLASDASTLPTAPNTNLSNLIDGDEGSFYAPGTNPPIANLCKKHALSNTNTPNALIPLDSTNNLSGAVLIQLSNPVPHAINSGAPTDSYGFIRFRVKVNPTTNSPSESDFDPGSGSGAG